MGFLRGTGLVFISIILFIILLLGGIFASLTLSLKYENVQPKIYTIADELIKTQIGEEQIKNEILPGANIYCQTNNEIVQSVEGYTIVFPCSVIRQGYDSTLNYTINYIVHDLYYKEYTCNFLDCFKNSGLPLFLVSDYSHKFWRALFLKFLMFSIVLFGLIFLLVKRKFNSLVLFGSLLIPVSFIIWALSRIGNFFMSFIFASETANNLLFSAVGIFFSESSRVFLWMLILGVVFIVSGIVLRIIFPKHKEEPSSEKTKEKKSGEKSTSKSEKSGISRKKKK